MQLSPGKGKNGVMQGCTYAVTKSPGAILGNAAGVGPKGRGQDARVNDRMSGNGVILECLRVVLKVPISAVKLAPASAPKLPAPHQRPADQEPKKVAPLWY
jgi:hypothetical protein